MARPKAPSRRRAAATTAFRADNRGGGKCHIDANLPPRARQEQHTRTGGVGRLGYERSVTIAAAR